MRNESHIVTPIAADVTPLHAVLLPRACTDRSLDYMILTLTFSAIYVVRNKRSWCQLTTRLPLDWFPYQMVYKQLLISRDNIYTVMTQLVALWLVTASY